MVSLVILVISDTPVTLLDAVHLHTGTLAYALRCELLVECLTLLIYAGARLWDTAKGGR